MLWGLSGFKTSYNARLLRWFTARSRLGRHVDGPSRRNSQDRPSLGKTAPMME